MVQSPSWEANWFAASQETPRISKNPNVHYRTHKRPPTLSILGQPNPVHIPTSHFQENHPNIIHHFFCIYLLTHSMVQSPSWEANWFAASQEIPRISRNSKVHYRTHKRPPPVSILGQPNPVHIPTFHFPEIHPNIIHPSKTRSPQWSIPLRFPHQDSNNVTLCYYLTLIKDQASHPYKIRTASRNSVAALKGIFAM